MEKNQQELKRGIKFFQENDYEKSISIFLKVIYVYQLDYKEKRKQLKIGKSKEKLKVLYDKNYINALDCIAACYIKIGNLDKALKYALVMISTEPTNCKSYLRVCKIYQLLNNEYKAKDTATKGYLRIREFKKNNPTYKVNENLYEQLKDEVKKYKSIRKEPSQDIENKTKPPSSIMKCSDPLNVLPIELIEKVFEVFNFQFCLQCLSVSRDWYDKLSNSSHIFGKFKLQKNIKRQQFDKFLKFLERAHDPKDLIHINLLELQPNPNVEKGILQTLFTKRLIIDEICLNLRNSNYSGLMEHLKLNKNILENIKSLNLELPVFIPQSGGLENSLSKFTKLEKLSLTVTDFDSRNYKFSDNSLTLKPITFNNLTYINIKIEPNARNTNYNTLLFQSFFENNLFPNLRHIILSNVVLGVNALTNVLNSKTETIELEKVPNMAIGLVIDTLVKKTTIPNSSLTKLRIIELATEHYNIQPETFMKLEELKILSNLETLIIENSCILPNLLNNILINSSSNLKKIYLFSNKYISFSKLQGSPVFEEIGYINIVEMISKIPKAEELSLSACSGFNSSTLTNMATYIWNNKYFHNLKYLNLSFNRINDESVKYFLNRPYRVKLNTLDLSYCQVSSNMVKYILDKNWCGRVVYNMDEKYGF